MILVFLLFFISYVLGGESASECFENKTLWSEWVETELSVIHSLLEQNITETLMDRKNVILQLYDCRKGHFGSDCKECQCAYPKGVCHDGKSGNGTCSCNEGHYENENGECVRCQCNGFPCDIHGRCLCSFPTTSLHWNSETCECHSGFRRRSQDLFYYNTLLPQVDRYNIDGATFDTSGLLGGISSLYEQSLENVTFLDSKKTRVQINRAHEIEATWLLMRFPEPYLFYSLSLVFKEGDHRTSGTVSVFGSQTGWNRSWNLLGSKLISSHDDVNVKLPLQYTLSYSFLLITFTEFSQDVILRSMHLSGQTHTAKPPYICEELFVMHRHKHCYYAWNILQGTLSTFHGGTEVQLPLSDHMNISLSQELTTGSTIQLINQVVLSNVGWVKLSLSSPAFMSDVSFQRVLEGTISTLESMSMPSVVYVLGSYDGMDGTWEMLGFDDYRLLEASDLSRLVNSQGIFSRRTFLRPAMAYSYYMWVFSSTSPPVSVGRILFRGSPQEPTCIESTCSLKKANVYDWTYDLNSCLCEGKRYGLSCEKCACMNGGVCTSWGCLCNIPYFGEYCERRATCGQPTFFDQSACNSEGTYGIHLPYDRCHLDIITDDGPWKGQTDPFGGRCVCKGSSTGPAYTGLTCHRQLSGQSRYCKSHNGRTWEVC